MSSTPKPTCKIPVSTNFEMNWVGGARSRIKQQNERKVQKDYFERKRLQSRVQRARPLSPGAGRSKKPISQDLIFLQALTCAHDTTKVPTFEPAREAQKVNLEGLRKLKRPERDLELPMSPIGHPSTLDFLDASVSSFSLYEDLPKVSTQKVPRLTILDSFGPPDGRKIKKHTHQLLSESGESPKENSNSSLSTSCMTESVFPVRKKPQTRQSSTWSQWTEQTVPAKRKHQAQTEIKQLVASKGAHNIWDKSYDHETPYDSWVSKAKRVPPPQLQTKGSLLEFHQCQRESRHGKDARSNLGCTAFKVNTTAENPNVAMSLLEAEERKSSESVAATLPVEKAFQPTLFAKETWKNSGKANVSSLLDEDPLSLLPWGNALKRAKVMDSATTDFDESILRPIKKKRQHRVPDPENRAEKQNETEPLSNKQKSLSTFERMLLSIEQERSSGHLQRSESEVGHEPAGEGEDTSAHHTEWKNFITGGDFSETKQPQVFRNDPLPQLVPKKASTSCTGSQEQEIREAHSGARASKPIPGYLNTRNISVMEELMCLDEELTSSLESDVLPSQEFTLSPAEFSEDPIHMVPDFKIFAPLIKKYITSSNQSQERGEAHRGVAEDPCELECSQVEDEAVGCARSEQKSTSLEAEVPECAVHCQHHHHYRDASCKCDLWATEGNKHTPNMEKENSHTQVPPPPAPRHAATQTLQAISIEDVTQTEDTGQQDAARNLTIHNCGEVEYQNTGTQTSPEAHGSQTAAEAMLPLDFPKEKYSLTEQLCSEEGLRSDGCRFAAPMGQKSTPIDAAVQTHKYDNSISDLKVQIACLEEKLEAAQNTIIWQSLVLKICQAETQ